MDLSDGSTEKLLLDILEELKLIREFLDKVKVDVERIKNDVSRIKDKS